MPKRRRKLNRKPADRRRHLPGTGDLLHRVYPIADVRRVRAEGGDDGDGDDDGRLRITLSASSDVEVRRWGDVEILAHGPDNVRLDRLRQLGAILVDHNPGLRAARVDSAKLDDGRLIIECTFGRSTAAKDFQQEVEDGLLRGVSVGYMVHAWEVDEDARTYTAIDWEPYEASLTAIPVDATVGVGRNASLDREAWRAIRTTSNPTTNRTGRPAPGEHTMDFEAWLRERGIDPATLTDAKRAKLRAKFLRAQRAEDGDDDEDDDDSRADDDDDDDDSRADDGEDDDDDDSRAGGDGDERAAARKLRRTRERAERAEMQLELRDLAESHGVQLSRAELRRVRSLDQGTRLLLEKVAQGGQRHNPQGSVGGNVIHVNQSGEDKRRSAVEDALLAHAGLAGDEDQGMRRFSPLELVRQLAITIDNGARDLAREDFAAIMSRQHHGLALRADGANQIADTFSEILRNAADKVVLAGYNNHQRTCHLWTRDRMVSDFKDVYGAAITAGLLEPQEQKGRPFKELALGEKSYSGALQLHGGTLSFTYQDWRNDDLGEFYGVLLDMGGLAGETEDYYTYELLLGLTWTNYITTSAAFWDDTNDRIKYQGLSKTMADLRNRTVAVGDQTRAIHPMPKFLLVPPNRLAAALAATGQAAGAEYINANAGRSYTVIDSPYLEAVGLSNEHSDDYYVVAGNMDTIKILRDRLNPAPVVRQVAQGRSPDLCYAVMHAFKPVLASQDGLQKGDWS